MPPGPEKRPSQHHREHPYSQPISFSSGRPQAAHLTDRSFVTNGLDSATQAAIQAAAAAAAAEALAQQQRQQQMAADVHLRAQTVPMPVQLPGDPAPVKVAAHSDPRKVAGKLAHTCRTSAAPSMVTTGSSCINQAVKAICIARGYLADAQMELTFQTLVRPGSTPDRPSVVLPLTRHPNSHWVPVPGAVEMAVSGSAHASSLANALVGRCREGTAVCLVGIGVDAVTNAVMAIGQARLQLESDGKNVQAWPEFVKVDKDGRQLNAIKFHVLVLG